MIQLSATTYQQRHTIISNDIPEIIENIDEKLDSEFDSGTDQFISSNSLENNNTQFISGITVNNITINEITNIVNPNSIAVNDEFINNALLLDKDIQKI